MCGCESHILGRDRQKVGSELEKTVFVQGNQKQLFQFWPGAGKSGKSGKSGAIVPILHILDPNYPSFYLKCPRKFQKTYNFDIFPALSQICASLPPKFWGGF